MAGSAARRSVGAQGHVLPRRQGQHLRFRDPPRLRSGLHVDGHGAAGGRRRRPSRRPQHGGVRRRSGGPERSLRPGSQSLEHRPNPGGIVERVGRGGRGAGVLRVPRFGHRRLLPAAGRHVRGGGSEAHLRPGQPSWRTGALLESRLHRSAGANRPRCRHDSPGGRRARRKRSDDRARRRSRLRRRARRRREGAEGRGSRESPLPRRGPRIEAGARGGVVGPSGSRLRTGGHRDARPPTGCMR